MKGSLGGIATEEVKVGSIDFGELFREQGLHHLKLKPSKKHLYVRTIPLTWAMKMTALPGKSAAVGIILWYLSGVSKGAPVTLSGVQLRRFGIQRLAGSRALKWLEAAGLVKVERSGNKSPRVTILEI
jgi:hypothetical protein